LIDKLSTEWVIFVEFTWCPNCERIKTQLLDWECGWRRKVSSFLFTIRTYPENVNKYSPQKSAHFNQKLWVLHTNCQSWKRNETLTCNGYKNKSCVTVMKDIERRSIRTNIINMCRSLCLKIFFNQLSLHIKIIANMKDKI
jgi:hypothetical protein